MKPNPSHKYLVVVTVEKELFRSCNKYDWSDYSYLRMIWVIIGEGLELLKAVLEGNTHGPHGIINEAAQVSAVAQKMILEVLRRTADEQG